LKAAEQALRAGDPGSALRALDEHARRYPNGSLAEERTVSRVLALCAAGRTDEARGVARNFLASRPSSPHLSRVRASCGGSSPN
jgi:outer membrane protein assembly factor BamD (BamD/ComL family)